MSVGPRRILCTSPSSVLEVVKGTVKEKGTEELRVQDVLTSPFLPKEEDEDPRCACGGGGTVAPRSER
jgi:hypothetical protein